MCLLASSTREDRLAALPGIAPPVPVIPGGVSGRSEAITEEDIWTVQGHIAFITLGHPKGS